MGFAALATTLSSTSSEVSGNMSNTMDQVSDATKLINQYGPTVVIIAVFLILFIGLLVFILRSNHRMNQQITTFEEMYEHVKDDGIYLCEDVYTSYWPNFGGGYKNPNSYIEYTKNLIDSLNAYWATEEDDLYPNAFTDSTYSIHYYDGIVIIEKRKRDTRYNDICQQAIIGKTKE